jgi:hypothetical protein
MQYEHEGAEQTFARFYAMLAGELIIAIQNRHCFLGKTKNTIQN